MEEQPELSILEGLKLLEERKGNPKINTTSADKKAPAATKVMPSPAPKFEDKRTTKDMLAPCSQEKEAVELARKSDIEASKSPLMVHMGACQTCRVAYHEAKRR